MALVDYSDSESESEPVANPPAESAASTSTASSKKAVQKVVDRANPRKILVNLSDSSAQDGAKPTRDEEPPAKRVRTGGGGAFSGFNAFLPPPKHAGKPPAASSSGKSAPRPGVNLKTGATPGFSRDNHDEEDGTGEQGDSTSGNDGGTGLPAPKAQQPSIPLGQKPADEVQLVGKPLMFKPLSVSRKPAKKNGSKVATPAKAVSANAAPSVAAQPEPALKEEAPRKKVSLFGIADGPADDVETAADEGRENGAYEPMFPSEDASSAPESFAEYDAQFSVPASSASSAQPGSLDSIAADMKLSATARRELFGRRGAPDPAQSAAAVINFNTDREYAHNEELRASGEQQIHNPVRAIAPGKHNLRQLVNQVHNQREALEESFAKGKNNRAEASSKYGW